MFQSKPIAFATLEKYDYNFNYLKKIIIIILFMCQICINLNAIFILSKKKVCITFRNYFQKNFICCGEHVSL